MPLSRKTSLQARQVIQKAFKELEQALAVPHAIRFQDTTIEDVRKACETMENELGARGLLRNMRRLEPLLNGLDCYSKAVDTLCQGTPFLPWIWAPIIVILKIGSDSISAFEALIKAYSKIGQSLSRFESLRIAFENDHGFQEIAAIFYRDIAEFHKCAYKFVTVNGWRRFFATTWGRFERKFSAILDSMDRHGELIDKEANARGILNTQVLLRQFESERKDKLEKIAAEQKGETGRNYQAIVARLQVNETDQLAIWDTLTSALQGGSEGTCSWLLKQEHVASWLSYDEKSHSLWLQGAAGTSKSVLAAHLARFRSLNNHIVIRHFCNDLYDSSIKYDQILKSILRQLLEVSDDATAYAYNLLVNERKSLAISTIEIIVRELIAIVSGSLQERRMVWIIIDGVDACDDAALLRCVSLMDSIALKRGDSHSLSCKVMFTSRHDPPIKGVRKRSVVSLSQESKQIRESIRVYTAQRLRLLPISDRLNLLGMRADEAVALGDEIATKADGMFLYAKLIIDYLSKQLFRTSQELTEALKELPPELKGFYRKIVSNITSHLSPASIASITCVLQWIGYADAPLQKLEILSAVSFTQGGSGVDRLVPSFFLQDCSALMEEKRNKTIGFIHATVKDFLSEPNSPLPISVKSAQRDKAMATVACLTSAAAKLPSEEGNLLIIKGVYTFLNYASKHWAEQVLVYAESCSRGGFRDAEFENAQECLAASLDRICISVSIVPSTAEQVDPRLEYLNSLCTIRTHVNMALLFQSHNHVHLRSQTKTHNISSEAIQFVDAVSVLLQKYRDAVRQMLSQRYHLGVTRDEFELFRTQVQPLFFTCRLPSCPNSSIGVETEGELALHELEHSKGFPCRDLGCQLPPFPSQKALHKHTLKYHTQSVPRRGLRRMREFYSNQSDERQPAISPTNPNNAGAPYMPGTPTVVSYQPASGIFGTRLYIKISTQYDLFSMSYRMPLFFLQFGSKKCPVLKVTRDKLDSSGFIYLCSVDAPQQRVTGCKSNKVPLSLVTEGPSGDEISKTIAGNFQYLDGPGDNSVTSSDKTPKLDGGAPGPRLDQLGLLPISSEAPQPPIDAATISYERTLGRVPNMITPTTQDGLLDPAASLAIIPLPPFRSDDMGEDNFEVHMKPQLGIGGMGEGTFDDLMNPPFGGGDTGEDIFDDPMNDRDGTSELMSSEDLDASFFDLGNKDGS